MKTSRTPRVNAGQAAAVFLIAIAMSACGGGDNGNGTGGATGTGATGGSGTGGAGTGGGGTGGAFTAATPPSDVCSLLTLSDAQSLLPAATAGVEQQLPDTTNLGFWSRDCKWDAGSTSIELVVFGAITKDGLNGVKLAAKSGDVNTPVSGLGEEAHYWQDTTHNTSGLWALQGSISVDVTAYFIVPAPPETQFHPLVAKALGEL